VKARLNCYASVTPQEFEMKPVEDAKTPAAKILVVEDEMPVAMMMVFLLHRAGCEVATATNAEQAVRLVQAADFDLITLDIDLPGGNGFEIFARLKKLPSWQNTPVVFVSGRPYEEDQQRATELGALDFISKPFDVEDFVSRILSHATPKHDFILATEGASA
jgi:DNA-binding response OmpR family regulator